VVKETNLPLPHEGQPFATLFTTGLPDISRQRSEWRNPSASGQSNVIFFGGFAALPK
jgi:hypothetical protein